MTDNEIIKALECCSSDSLGSCRKCPGKGSGCELEGYALALITRQKAEIKRLEKRLETVQAAKCVYSYDGETVEYCVHSPCPICKTVDQIKSEAIREFAERLKRNVTINNTNDGYLDFAVDYNCLMEDIDDVVKEMEG